MSVLDPAELERSPLADLHAIAAELGIEGFRRLRREDLIAAILGRREGAPAGGEAAAAEAEAAAEPAPPEETEPPADAPEAEAATDMTTEASDETTGATDDA